MNRFRRLLVLLFWLALPGLMLGGSTTQIVRADYGVGDKWVDVTARVRSLVKNDTLSFRVDNSSLSIDPQPGTAKSLKLQIRDNKGALRQLTFREREYVNLRLGADNLGYAAAAPVGLTINDAQYGAGSHLSDVTTRLNSRIQDGRLNLQVTNDTMGGDPAKGEDKTLNVQYTYNGKKGQVFVREGDTLSLPQGSAISANKLQIVHAEYGAGSRMSNVTALLNSRIQDARLKLKVINENMGGDPAKGQDKTLSVQYTYNGKTSRVLLNEGDTLNLPDSNATSQKKLQILYAEYGAEGRVSDVTDRLNSNIQGDQLYLQVTKNTMGGDPASNQDNILTVQYTYDGKTSQTFVREGGTLRLPDTAATSQRLQILHAEYGAGSRMSDVTARLNAAIQNDQLYLQVTNDTMGLDPAQNQNKTLSAQYAYDARQRQIIVQERDYLRLPSTAQSLSSRSATYTTIPSGTKLAIRTNEIIDSKTAKPGQTFSAVMYEDVRDNTGALAIPKGSNVELVIRGTTNSNLVLDINSLMVGGQTYVVSTGNLEKKGREGLGANRRTAEMVGGGAAAGAVVGAIVGGGKGAAIGAGIGAAGGAGVQVLTKGGEVRVPAETVLNFKLDQDLRLQPSS